MYIVERSRRFIQGALTSYGPTAIKKFIWDWMYSRGEWDFLDNTVGDCVYPHLEKYAKNGSILDLGCGPGNTANELAATAYRTYLGVDISEPALEKARRRTEQNGRADKNSFAQGDFLSYVPPQQFDLILFRESMYHVPRGKIKTVLDRFAEYLRDGGVFIVRMFTSGGGKIKRRPTAMINLIESEFDVVEKAQYGDRGATVIVFRPKARAKSGDTSSGIAAQPV